MAIWNPDQKWGIHDKIPLEMVVFSVAMFDDTGGYGWFSSLASACPIVVNCQISEWRSQFKTNGAQI